MKKTIVFLINILCCVLAHGQTGDANLKFGKPADWEMKMTEYPDDNEANAVVLCSLTDVRYDFINGDFRIFYEYKTRIKILKPEGKDEADVSIYYIDQENNHSMRETITGLKASAYNMENGKVVKTKMDVKSVNTERLDKQQKVLKFSVPQAKVGSVIEYEYTLQSDYYYDIRDWFAQRSIPVYFTRYCLSTPEWFKFHIEETGSAEPFEKKTDGHPMSLTLSDGSIQLMAEDRTFIGRHLPALKNDDFVWSVTDYSNKVRVELSGIQIPGAIYKNYTNKWEDIERILLDDEDFGDRMKNCNVLKEEIEQAGINSIPDKKERAAHIYQLLKKHVRWNGSYRLWGNPASKVLKEGNGSNADINFMLISLLRNAGIESYPIVLRNRSNGILPLSHASMKYLSTMVVGIKDTDSTTVYIDGSVENGYFNILPANLLVNKARAIAKDGNGFWVDLQEVAHGRKAVSIVAKLGVDGLLTGSRDSQYYEETAASFRKELHSCKDSTEMKHRIAERNGVEVSSYKVKGSHAFSPSVKEHLTFSKQENTADDVIYLNPLVFIPHNESPFKETSRNLPVEFPYKQSENINVQIEIPEGYTPEELPKPISVKTKGLSFRMATVVNGGKLQTSYRYRIEKVLFLSDEYEELKMFFDMVTEHCKDVVTLKKTKA